MWKAFCHALEATASLSPRRHPQINGRTERANQQLEATLWCVVEANPSSWSIHLAWIEYTLNSQTSVATGLLKLPLVVNHPCSSLRRVRCLSLLFRPTFAADVEFGSTTHAALLHSVESNKHLADHHRTLTLSHQSGQSFVYQKYLIKDQV